MYNCEACGLTSKPHQYKITFNILRVMKVKAYDPVKGEFINRANREIVREVACCAECKLELEAGVSLHELQVVNNYLETHVKTLPPTGKAKQSSKQSSKQLTMDPGAQLLPTALTGVQVDQLLAKHPHKSIEKKQQVVVNKPLTIGKSVTTEGFK